MKKNSSFKINPKWGFGIVFGLAIFVFILRGLLASNFKYEITEPDYSKSSTGTTSHFCDSYTEQGNCIKFIDEFGNKQKICGNYKIINH